MPTRPKPCIPHRPNTPLTSAKPTGASVGTAASATGSQQGAQRAVGQAVNKEGVSGGLGPNLVPSGTGPARVDIARGDDSGPAR